MVMSLHDHALMIMSGLAYICILVSGTAPWPSAHVLDGLASVQNKAFMTINTPAPPVVQHVQHQFHHFQQILGRTMNQTKPEIPLSSRRCLASAAPQIWSRTASFHDSK